MTARRHLFWILLPTLAALVGVGTFTAWQDPYQLWSAPVEADLYKPEYERRHALGKTAQLQRVLPDAILAGNSRAEVALDPAHPGWGGELRVFNLALGGANLSQVAASIRYAHGLRPLRRLVMIVDMSLFQGQDSGRSDFAATDMALDRREPWQWFAGRLLQTVDGDAFASAWRQWRRADRGPRGAQPTASGMNDPERYRRLVDRPGGAEAMFQEMLERFAPAYRDFSFRLPNGGDTRLVFRDLVAFLERERIPADFVISPLHARHWLLVEREGAWSHYEDWMRALAAPLAAANEASRLRLWDFWGASPATLEPVPDPQSADQCMRWHYEPSHFSIEAGDRLLQQVLSGRPGGEDESVRGVLVSAHDIEAHLVRRREEMQRLLQSIPAPALP